MLRRFIARFSMPTSAVLTLATCVGLHLATPNAWAELPDAPTLLADLGFTKDEISRIEGGAMVEHSVPAASDRELTTGLAFYVPVAPKQLVESSRRDLLDRVDPNMMAFGTISTPAAAGDFAKLTLAPDGAKRAKAYVGASPGQDLNLSNEEIAAFHALGSGAAPAAVEAHVRAALIARVEAYRAKGLAGIAPYARKDGKARSAADELRTAIGAAKKFAQYAPAAYGFLSNYPKDKPAGSEEILRWAQLEAHGVPTIVLTQVILVPDGEAWLLSQRQFYVSTGYNAEQALAAFLPAKAGTIVVYANRTSTDQITGFGGSAKRSIGSKLLASQLQGMFEKARAKLK